MDRICLKNCFLLGPILGSSAFLSSSTYFQSFFDEAVISLGTLQVEHQGEHCWQFVFLLRYYDEMEALADEFQDANGKKVPSYYGFFIHNSLYYFLKPFI
jgi:hypothetical protein